MTRLSEAFDTGMRAFQSGALETAEQAFREAITADPNHIAAHIHLAHTLEAQSRLGEAVIAIDRGLDMHSENAELLFESARLIIDHERREIEAGNVRKPYGFAFPWGAFSYPIRAKLPQSRKPQAVERLNACLRIDPEHGPARVLLGLQLLQSDSTVNEAAALIQAGLSAAPDFALSHYAMGRLALRGGAFPVAMAAFDSALERGHDKTMAEPLRDLARHLEGADHPINTGDIEGLITLADGLQLTLGNPSLPDAVRQRTEDLAEKLAPKLIDAAIDVIYNHMGYIGGARMLYAGMSLRANHPDAPVALGALFYADGRFDVAEANLENAIKAGSTHPMAAHLRDLVRVVLGKKPDTANFEEALDSAELMRLTVVFCNQQDFVSAEHWCRKAVDKAPRDPESLMELAHIQAIRGGLSDAVESGKRALSLAPDDIAMRMGLCSLYLGTGQPEKAWPLYENRLQRFRRSTPRPTPPVPRWDGQDLGDKTLLVWREMGIGDEVVYASCLNDFTRQWPGRIIFECTPRLTTIYRRSFPEITIRGEDPDDYDYEGIDFHLPVGSLPLYLRCSLDAYATSGPYLVPDEDRVRHWRERLQALGDGPKIGIGWRSLNMSWSKRPNHSKLIDQKPVLEIPGLNFVNLQPENVSEEVAAVRETLGVTLHSFTDLDLMNDLEDVTALMAALDAVVSPRCWIITFAGFVGTKGYCYAGTPNTLMLGQDASPWTPNVDVFYKQPDGGWAEPMAALAEALRERFDQA